MRGIYLRFIVVLCCALLPLPAVAHPDLEAAITGVATASDGARLPGVTLRLVNEASGQAVESVTGEAGRFRIQDLPPGRYRLEAEISGFEPRHIPGILLEPGASVGVEVRLEIATIHETVAVIGETGRDVVEVLAMRESRARDLGEALGVLPGIARVRKGAIANDVVVRGFQGKDVTVLIDGQRLDGACPGHMDPPAFHVDFSEIARVEVSRGPFDVKNQGGLAGVVNVVTERPQRGLHGSANLNLASAATLAGSTAVSVGRARWAALGGASARRADPYRDGAGVRITDQSGYRPDAVEDTPAYDIWTAWGRMALVPRDGTALQLSYTRQSAGTILYPYLQMDALFDNADRAGARFETDLPGRWDTLVAHGYLTRVDHWMTDQLRTTGAGKAREYSMGTRAKTQTAGGRAEITRSGLTAGFEASRRNWNTQTMLAMKNYAAQAAMPDVTIDVVGLFATYSQTLGARWRVEAGGRMDRADTSADPDLANTNLYAAYHDTRLTRVVDTLPAGYVRARWRDRGWSAVLGAGHSVRLPDQQERFYALSRMGSDWVGNPLLEPSRNTGFEGELRYTRRGSELTLSAFAYRVADAIRVLDQRRIAMVPGVMNTMARSYTNVDAFTRGLEASATVPLAPSLWLSSDLSLGRGTVRDNPRFGEDLPEMPPARLRVRLRVDRARWSGAAEVVAAARQDRVALDLREMPTGAYAVLNLRGDWRLRGATVMAALDNVFDTLYAEHLSYQRDPFRNGVRVYEPGRTASLSMAFRF